MLHLLISNLDDRSKTGGSNIVWTVGSKKHVGKLDIRYTNNMKRFAAVESLRVLVKLGAIIPGSVFVDSDPADKSSNLHADAKTTTSGDRQTFTLVYSLKENSNLRVAKSILFSNLSI